MTPGISIYNRGKRKEFHEIFERDINEFYFQSVFFKDIIDHTAIALGKTGNTYVFVVAYLSHGIEGS